ncbi:PREDICTED: mRNAion factor [Prunus dulcis]|uniref:PREDICTED: mRNAion factor n=1 Tax=Prunus dulcis TaxID=3755 RepID=A0A5E4ESF8_PRUDU|nr:PREDICTED: mRNAion factor [Prunus dulcis]
MTHRVPDWAATTTITTTTTEEGDSSKSFQYEDFGPLLDSVVPHHHPHPQTETETETDHDYSVWNINTSGASGATGAAEDHNHKCFQEIFEDLSNIQLEPTITPNAIFSSDKHFVCDFDKGELKTTSRFMETKSVSGEGIKPKRTRAAELHNMSERKRRKKIRGKLGALQQLIPNCNTSDRASMLDDAIKHIKALKLQIQMMSMGRGALYQASNLSMAGMQSTQTPQFMSYVPMGTSNAYGMGMGMGMVNMCYSTTGLPIMSVPSAGFNPLQPATAGFPLMSAPGVLPVNPQLQMPMPFVASQVMPTATTTSRSRNMGQPQFATDFSHTFNYAKPRRV